MNPPEMIRVLKPGLDGGAGDAQKLFVVGFDPGVTTGWCVMRVQLEALLAGGLRGVALGNPDPEVFSWSAGRFSGPDSYQAELMMALCRGTWMHGEGEFLAGLDSDLFVVVIEDFILRVFSSDRDLLSPVRVSAAFRALSWRAPFPCLVYQSSDALNVLNDDRLRRLNLWSGEPGKRGEHQRDATRHAGLVVRKATDPKWLDELESRMPWINLEATG